MKMKLALVTIAAAALAVSTDSHAMIRVGRARVARPSVHLRLAKMPNLAQNLQRFKGQAAPHITKPLIQAKEEQKRLLQNVETKMKTHQTRQNRLGFSLGLSATLITSLIVSDTDFFMAPLVGATTGLSMMVNGALLAHAGESLKEVMSAQDELEAFAKQQKAETSFVPDIK